MEIQGTPSNSPGVPFNDNYSMQRPGLLLLGGVVYMAFASDCDLTPYRGVVVGVSESMEQITTMWSDESGVGTDQDSQAGIWQSGGGLISDGANQIILGDRQRDRSNSVAREHSARHALRVCCEA